MADYAVRAERPVQYTRDSNHPADGAPPSDTPGQGKNFKIPDNAKGTGLGAYLAQAGLSPRDAQIVARMSGYGNANRIKAGDSIYIPTRAEIDSARTYIRENEGQQATKVPDVKVRGAWEGATPGSAGAGVRVGGTQVSATPTPAVADPKAVVPPRAQSTDTGAVASARAGNGAVPGRVQAERGTADVPVLPVVDPTMLPVVDPTVQPVVDPTVLPVLVSTVLPVVLPTASSTPAPATASATMQEKPAFGVHREGTFFDLTIDPAAIGVRTEVPVPAPATAAPGPAPSGPLGQAVTGLRAGNSFSGAPRRAAEQSLVQMAMADVATRARGGTPSAMVGLGDADRALVIAALIDGRTTEPAKQAVIELLQQAKDAGHLDGTLLALQAGDHVKDGKLGDTMTGLVRDLSGPNRERLLRLFATAQGDAIPLVAAALVLNAGRDKATPATLTSVFNAADASGQLPGAMQAMGRLLVGPNPKATRSMQPPSKETLEALNSFAAKARTAAS